MGWAWHQELREPSFCYALLGELKSLLWDVEANWLEAVTMDAISLLLRQLLLSSPDEGVSLKALGLLCTVCSRVFTWVRELLTMLTRTLEDEEFRGYLWDCAAVCRSTFDVDPHLVHSLLKSVEDFNVLVSCAIFIHDYTPNSVSGVFTYLQLLLDQDCRLLLALKAFLTNLLQANSSNEGVDLAIGWVWHDYRLGSNWAPLLRPNEHWISCTTMLTAKQCLQVVHFNLHEGSLLVDERQLGRLPSTILQHPLYNMIFGKVCLAMPKSTSVTNDIYSKCLMLSQEISQGWTT